MTAQQAAPGRPAGSGGRRSSGHRYRRPGSIDGDRRCRQLEVRGQGRSRNALLGQRDRAIDQPDQLVGRPEHVWSHVSVERRLRRLLAPVMRCEDTGSLGTGMTEVAPSPGSM